ncbi:MAG: helix-turn-helix domain-containing protein, partial [Acidobacteria bacterium]|nr:helix-turn-helix domain-containing protein [Acidobacteriota bacterium]NIO58476.1 helix-turn-helix domain-containing protein [Acidobacteriota bacterium]NIQ84868.1 helix-turn-helix domain-containing protein [Acidobacteriota bacterium]
AIRSTPAVVFSVATQVEGRFKRLESRIEDLVFRSALARVAHILLQLADDFGETDGARTKIPIRLTHTELAKLVGTSRPTTSIAIGELEDDSLITRDDGRFVLLDRGALERVAERERNHRRPYL